MMAGPAQKSGLGKPDLVTLTNGRRDRIANGIAVSFGRFVGGIQFSKRLDGDCLLNDQFRNQFAESI